MREVPAVVTQIYNPSFLGGRDLEDCGSRASLKKI
jgi:hypothetical protein